ncbi:MAB_1171c family putative transporter [Streptomyces sp. NBC_01481]|uniref:MAB_1171c family putative transporter n=1 Tax=Streptomyces sp. NBC_01481 TaxID=2975869 RepID=UPI0022546857|nr:MAB_1171c family putative transporter [Streptomyces sp. NBC_01481]MCX4586283.1 hypothetical protein [Streptomyces sp. NBC_01481]
MTAIRPFDLVLLGPLWAATLYMGRRALTAGRHAGPMSGMVALITLAITLGVPGVRRVIDTMTGMESVTNLLLHLLTLSAISCLIAFVHQISEGTSAAGRAGRWRWIPLPAAGILLCCAFLLSPRPDGDQHLLTQTPSAAGIAYWSIYLLYVLWGTTAAGLMCLRYGRRADPGPLRTSLRILGAACVSSLIYATHRAVHLTAHGSGHWLFQDTVAVATTQALLATTLLLFVVGIAWPSATGLMERSACRRRLRGIRPLWQALGKAVPEVVLPLPSELERDPKVLLYRRIIEISDGMLALHPYRSEAARGEASRHLVSAGLTGRRLDAAAEAVCLRHAIARKDAGFEGNAPEAATGSGNFGEAQDDLEAQVAWLEVVSRLYGSRIVRRVSEAVANSHADSVVGESAPTGGGP